MARANEIYSVSTSAQCAKNGQSQLPVPMAPCMLVQLFKLLSTEGARQLASRSGREINTVLPLKKRPI